MKEFFDRLTTEELKRAVQSDLLLLRRAAVDDRRGSFPLKDVVAGVYAGSAEIERRERCMREQGER